MKKLLSHFFLIALTACGQISCNKKERTHESQIEALDRSTDSIHRIPDVGGVEHVDVVAKGAGITPGAAINDALRTAIMQVNGTVIASMQSNLNTLSEATASFDVETSSGSNSARLSASARSRDFAELIVSSSGGVVSSFEVVALTPPTTSRRSLASNAGDYSVEIKAKIAKFRAPADSGKIRIAIAPLRTGATHFNIGGQRVPAEDVVGSVREHMINSLTQSGRFLVLDRQFEDELQSELHMIESGQTSNENLAKLSQALSADLVWVGVVNNLAYERNARRLQTADRELVGFSGSWSISQRLINLTTRQVMISSTLSGQFPTIAPTTMGAGFNQTNLLRGFHEKFVQMATEAIMLRTFPISIVEIEGTDVVLSQGEGSLKVNDRYNVYRLGREIRDPQTGEVLGNMESLFGVVVVTRVTPRLAYGRLENVTGSSDGVLPGALQIREAISSR